MNNSVKIINQNFFILYKNMASNPYSIKKEESKKAAILVANTGIYFSEECLNTINTSVQ